jgi:hypothetical protein
MRSPSWIAAILLTSITGVFAQDISYENLVRDIGYENLARPERYELAKCFSDAMTVIEKYRLTWMQVSTLLLTTCAAKIERAESAAKDQLKDNSMKEILAEMMIFMMVDKATEIYKEHGVMSCSGTGCSLDDYRMCLMRGMPKAIKAQTKPIDFEKAAQQQCEDFESAARAALTNDLDSVLKIHSGGGISHEVNDAIVDIIVGLRHDVVLLYGQELAKVQPPRRDY